MKLITVAGKKKHKDAIFIVDLDAPEDKKFLFKVYGHQGQDAKGNARLLICAIDTYLFNK